MNNLTKKAFHLLIIVLLITLSLSCTDIEFLKTTSTDKEPEEPRIIMQNIESHIINQGIIERKIKAEKAIYYEGRQLAELQNVVTIFFEQGEKTGRLVADKGMLFLADNSRLNASRHDLSLTGNINYEGKDGTLLETSALYWDDKKGELRCDTEYVRKTPVKDGIIEIRGKQFSTNRNLTEWYEKGATVKLITSPENKEEK